MDKILLINYRVEDFVADETFINYHFNSNKKDTLFWKEWFLLHPEKLIMANDAIEIIDSLSLSISKKEYKEEYNKIKKAIRIPRVFSGLFTMNNLKPLGHRKRNRKMQYVIVLLIFIFACGFWFLKPSKNRSYKLTEIVNNSNFQRIITLSDSTIVSLEPHSNLKFPLNFGEKERDVFLSGDAHFSVKRNLHLPFKVHTENIVTTVLGTVFNIRKSGDSAIVVELLKGKLRVQIMNSNMQPEQSILLVPNERAVYVKNRKYLYKNQMDETASKSLSFKKSTFEEIAAKIKVVYGITLMNKSDKKTFLFTGEFKNSSAKEIVENICLIKNLSYEVHGDTILIK